MFRRLKSKTGDNSARNIRQRIEDEGDAQIISAKRTLPDDSQTVNIDNEDTLQTTGPKHTGLSFNEGEGDDLVGFKLKKHGTHGHRSVAEANEKTLRKQKMLAARAERIKIAAADITIKREDGIDEETMTKQNTKSLDETAASLSEEIISVNSMEDVREAFPTSFDGIPDAKAVYEARKKREILRQKGTGGNSGEFIPLDDTVRLKGSGQSGERSRLVREDENDMSDEEEGGSFYSAKKLLQTEEDARREEQANFLSLEQGSSDEDGIPLKNGNRRRKNSKKTKKDVNEEISDAENEDDELQRWEREQIMKGVSSNKVMQMRNELAATNLYYPEYSNRLEKEGEGEAEMDIEVDLEILDVQQQNVKISPTIPKPDNSTIPELANGTKSKVSLEQLLNGLQQRLDERKENSNTMESELKRTQGQIAENTDSIHKLEHYIPQLEHKFKMLQDVRIYTRDLLDCLNEKFLNINALEERLMKMWKQRTERLIKRRRQDVQDQYERCAANAAGRSFIIPNPEFAQRETEREARRNRRRIKRENQRLSQNLPTSVQSMPSGSNIHFDGLSSDDEETQSQHVFYAETQSSVEQSANDLFFDTEEDFCQVQNIISRILKWLAIDEDSFEKAYVSLCLPKLLGPFIRLQMLNWRPLKNDSLPLHSFPWYKQLLMAGLDNSGLENIEHSVLVQLIPNVVEKVIFPKIARIIREQWDPLSLNESTNLGTFLRSLIDDYPITTTKSKRMNEILDLLHSKFRDVLENDTFVPLYSKDAIEAVETGCAEFMDRQFWKSIKIIRSILCFRGILSDLFLEELVMEGLVNRCVVMSLQFGSISNPTIIPKCLALCSQIPVDWLSQKRRSSNTYRPLEILLKKVIEFHRQKDRKFAEQIQNFVNLLSDSIIKTENTEEDEEDDE
uniref:GCF C-terminal domain-containing protein n=1 Tax=Meloidogyne incognita TaxID=6306 RepID=A0A914LPY2_MELIC